MDEGSEAARRGRLDDVGRGRGPVVRRGRANPRRTEGRRAALPDVVEAALGARPPDWARDDRVEVVGELADETSGSLQTERQAEGSMANINQIA